MIAHKIFPAFKKMLVPRKIWAHIWLGINVNFLKRRNLRNFICFLKITQIPFDHKSCYKNVFTQKSMKVRQAHFCLKSICFPPKYPFVYNRKSLEGSKTEFPLLVNLCLSKRQILHHSDFLSPWWSPGVILYSLENRMSRLVTLITVIYTA